MSRALPSGVATTYKPGASEGVAGGATDNAVVDMADRVPDFVAGFDGLHIHQAKACFHTMASPNPAMMLPRFCASNLCVQAVYLHATDG